MFSRISRIQPIIRNFGKVRLTNNSLISQKAPSRWNIFKKNNKTTAVCASIFLLGTGGAAGYAGAGYIATSNPWIKLKPTSAFAEELQIKDEESVTKEIAMERIRATYKYVFAGICTTGLAVIGASKLGIATKILTSNPFVFLGCTVAAMIPSTHLLFTTDYEREKIKKHALFVANHMIFGAMISPIVYAGGALVTQAALATGCIIGALSFAGMKGDPNTFAQMRAPLAIGLGIVVSAGLGSMFFPIALLENIALYGGLAVFSGLTMTDTSRMIKSAQSQMYYDPINEGMPIYLDFLNIFIRIVNILQNKQQR